MGRLSSEKKPRILVIDDNQDVLDLLRDELTAEGYEVETAVDGLAGLRALKRSKPDLVIIDIMMPQISGPAVMTLIGEKDHYRELRDVPMIIISAQSNIEYVREEGLPLGESDYLTKPIDFDRLHDLIRRKLGRHASDTPPRTDTAHLAHA
ncbi:MAG: response regulator [Chloracidobacterium sp.]|nr:response regulator [Chloracidobacterium sp.]MDW8218727.1 response regulator [Acidobacteriota bacterium]